MQHCNTSKTRCAVIAIKIIPKTINPSLLHNQVLAFCRDSNPIVQLPN